MNTELPQNNKGDKFWLWIVKQWSGDTVGKVTAVVIFFGFFIPYFTFKILIRLIDKLWISTKKQCPKCDSREVKQVKPSSMQKALPGSLFFLFGPIGLLAKQSKTLNVCRVCGFSWEDR
jgi:hypothetical protein